MLKASPYRTEKYGVRFFFIFRCATCSVNSLNVKNAVMLGHHRRNSDTAVPNIPSGIQCVRLPFRINNAKGVDISETMWYNAFC